MDNLKRNDLASLEKTLSEELGMEKGQEGDSVTGIWTKFRMGNSSQENGWNALENRSVREDPNGVPDSSSVRAAF